MSKAKGKKHYISKKLITIEQDNQDQSPDSSIIKVNLKTPQNPKDLFLFISSISKLKLISKAAEILLLEKLLKYINKTNSTKTANLIMRLWLNIGIINIDNTIE